MKRIKQYENFGSKFEKEPLIKKYKFENIYKATNFLKNISSIFNNIDHHPDYLNWSGDEIEIGLYTHSAGSVTEKDFYLVNLMNEEFDKC